MRLRASEVAEATGGRLEGPDATCSSAVIDSRVVSGGELFVPVVAARDGHDFVAAALEAGALAYLTARKPEGATAVVVEDTSAALGRLGSWARGRLTDRVVAITGSAGKTSTKDLLASVLGCRFPTAASERSFNNELGVPLTLLNSPEGCGAVVVEMGARGLGHIASLCVMARPTVGVVTNVGHAHTELLGSLEGVARAKSELVAALPPDGTAVLNADDARVAAMASATDARVLTFGLEGGDVRATDVVVDDELRPSFRLTSPWGRTGVALTARGAHQVPNALAAAAAALAVGVSLDDVATGLARAALSPWRMELARAPSGALVLNDSYNANPQSTSMALRALASLPAERRLAVLGPMLELGEVSEAEHRRVGDLARELGVDRVITVGAPNYGGEDTPDLEQALAVLGPLGPGDAVLVKASRAAGLERLARALVTGGNGEVAWSPS